MGLSYTCFVYFSFIYILLFSVFSACGHDDMQVSQGMVGQSAARRAAGIILEMVKVSLMWMCERTFSCALPHKIYWEVVLCTNQLLAPCP